MPPTGAHSEWHRFEAITDLSRFPFSGYYSPVHVREVIKIDWDKIWDKQAVIASSKDAKQAFQDLVE